MIVRNPCRAASATSATLICGAVEKSSVTRRKSLMEHLGEAGRRLGEVGRPFVDIIGGGWKFRTGPPVQGPSQRPTRAMLRYIGRRLLIAIPTLFLVITAA